MTKRENEDIFIYHNKLQCLDNFNEYKVIHLRNICPDISDKELVQLALPFGKVKRIINLKAKNQAFIEFLDHGPVLSMQNFFKHPCPQKALRNYQIIAQISNHKILDTTHVSTTTQSSSESIIHTLNSLYDANSTQEHPSCILRVVFSGNVELLNLSIIHQIFTKFGKVLKLILFNKTNSFQSFVQYEHSGMAQIARLNLTGAALSGCVISKIDFSRLQDLEIKYNNNKMHDYTKDTQIDDNISPVFIPLTNTMQQTQSQQPSYFILNVPSNILKTPHIIVQNDMLLKTIDNVTINNMNGGEKSCVILVNNLNQKRITADALFLLFGVYGDVLKVKIMYNKRDSALVQMSNPTQANLAIMHLDNAKIYGQNIHCAFSKHTTILMPKTEQNDLTKDYTLSPLHRFKKPGSKNYQNIFPPSPVLHLSNIPVDLEDTYLPQLFIKAGFDVKGFKFFINEKRMALIELKETEQAIAALIELHNHPLNNTHNLRISFSKSQL